MIEPRSRAAKPSHEAGGRTRFRACTGLDFNGDLDWLICASPAEV